MPQAATVTSRTCGYRRCCCRRCGAPNAAVLAGEDGSPAASRPAPPPAARTRAPPACPGPPAARPAREQQPQRARPSPPPGPRQRPGPRHRPPPGPASRVQPALHLAGYLGIPLPGEQAAAQHEDHHRHRRQQPPAFGPTPPVDRLINQRQRNVAPPPGPMADRQATKLPEPTVDLVDNSPTRSFVALHGKHRYSRTLKSAALSPWRHQTHDHEEGRAVRANGRCRRGAARCGQAGDAEEGPRGAG